MDDLSIRAHAAMVQLLKLKHGIETGADIHPDEITEAAEAGIEAIKRMSKMLWTNTAKALT